MTLLDRELSPSRVKRATLIVAVLVCAHAAASPATVASVSECSWPGPSPEWVLAMNLTVEEMSGTLGKDIIALFHRQGIPVSFFSRPDGDPPISLVVIKGMTVQEALEEIVRQAPGYRYGVVDGKVVIFPVGDEYDVPISVTRTGTVTRAAAYIHLLRQLKTGSEALQDMAAPVLRGPNLLHRDLVEIGGAHSVVEHMTSLVRERGSAAFLVWCGEDRRLGGILHVALAWIPLVERIDVAVPAVVEPGAAFVVAVTATLVDGSVVRLAGPGCGVEYSPSKDGIVEIDEAGQGVARAEGTVNITIRYEDKIESRDIRVESSDEGS